MSFNPQENLVYPHPQEDGRRPVIINAHPNNGQNFPKRNQTLSRPERQPTMRRPMMRMENRPPPAARAGATSGRTLGRPTAMPPPDEDEEQTGCWTICSKILTFWAIGPVMSCFQISKNKGVQQAWREKIALCIIIVFCWGLMGFFTVGIQPTFCPDSSITESVDYNAPKIKTLVRYMGNLYKLTDIREEIKKKTNYELPDSFTGINITPMFRDCKKNEAKCVSSFNDPCSKYFDSSSEEIKCVVSSKGNDKYEEGCLNSSIMKSLESKIVHRVAYGWDDIDGQATQNRQITVYNGLVIDLKDLKLTDKRFAKILPTIKRSYKVDATRYYEMSEETQNAMKCFSQLYSVGKLDKVNSGCFLSRIIMYVSMICILGIVLTRFFMAIIFSWFVSSKLVEQQTGISDANKQIYTICLVTAYSEGEEGIRCTLNSLASTTYPDKMELLFVIADGIIFGSGNDRSTPDICTKMIIEDPKLGTAEPKSYFAIADGEKQHNMARAHAGVYIVDGHKVPAVVVVKCGTPKEQNGPKPGNRGKRDSQLLLMNFLSRVTFDDRMTPLDYDLFKKIQHIAGVTPDKYEIVLMVDADTKVMPTSLSYMITAMRNDPMIMGLCGETRIANKTTSWVTWIQVFEYYISHHLGKSFESLFGGVTCLPGCFCMYRIKAPKPGSPNTYVPVLANPDIVEDYSENIVDTLHKKNLLLLGEDRFLTTLMLRTFPKRKMVFVPQALCKTIVPDEFKVLLSQRRRWINSTIHNLMELVLVRDLCGTFCFSMQFVVGMELFGTVVLPAAIIFTFYLIIELLRITKEAVDVSGSTSQAMSYIWDKGPVMPLIMLVSILGLPGVLIMLTSQKFIYILWMFVYLAGLPVWNFILPVYAFWHFDDFSWGETRKVEGDTGGDDHGKKEGVFDASSIPLKRWHEYEKENRIRQGGSPYVTGTTSPYSNAMSSPLQRLPSVPSKGPSMKSIQLQHTPSNKSTRSINQQQQQQQPVQRIPSNRQPPPNSQIMQSPSRSGSNGQRPFVPKPPQNTAHPGAQQQQRMGNQRPPYIPPNNNGFR